MTLAEMMTATHYELTSPFGRRVIVDSETYMALPEEALALTVPRALQRRDMIRRRSMARRPRGS